MNVLSKFTEPIDTITITPSLHGLQFSFKNKFLEIDNVPRESIVVFCCVSVRWHTSNHSDILIPLVIKPLVL